MPVPAVAAATDPAPDDERADAGGRRLHAVTAAEHARATVTDATPEAPPAPRLLHAVDDAPAVADAPAARPSLPDAAVAAEGLARCVLEILAGARDLDQVSRWVNGEVWAVLQKRVRLAARAREASGVRSQRPVFRVGRVHVSEPAPGVAETVVVVHGRARTRSVAIRLETTGRRWRATALHVL